MKADEFIADDGSVRKVHYGSGNQPFDTILDAGWGPGFAAGNILKYLRRDKEKEHSLESARWYWDQIVVRSATLDDWRTVRHQLRMRLTDDELSRLIG